MIFSDAAHTHSNKAERKRDKRSTSADGKSMPKPMEEVDKDTDLREQMNIARKVIDIIKVRKRYKQFCRYRNTSSHE